jgi:hypothetical protein
MRPKANSDKGSGAQHRQAIRLEPGAAGLGYVYTKINTTPTLKTIKKNPICQNRWGFIS